MGKLEEINTLNKWIKQITKPIMLELIAKDSKRQQIMRKHVQLNIKISAYGIASHQ